MSQLIACRIPNLSEYSSDVMLIGADGYLFLSGKSAQIFDAACNNQFPPSCSCLVPIDEDCSPDATDLSLDTFFVTTMLSNLAQSETQTGPWCNEDKAQWNPQTIVSKYNPTYFASKNITVANVESAVFTNINFSTSDIIKTTYNPQSGPSTCMFGSLSG